MHHSKSWKKLVVITFLTCLNGILLAQPVGYYNGTENLSGEELKTALHNIIKDHVDFSYSEAKYLINYSDADPDNPNNVILFYTQLSRNASLYGSTPGTINREHVWAKSHGGFSGVRPMDSDALNLRPADTDANMSRSNLDFDIVQPNGTLDPYAIYSWYNDSAYEPGPLTKGQVARILFYMDTRYEGTDGEMDLELARKVNNYPAAKFGNLTTLLKWNKEYPPSAMERQRNDRIFRMQQNRNPFVDHPEFADLIYEGATPTGAVFANFSMSPEFPTQDEESLVSITISNAGELSDVSLFWGNTWDTETNQAQMTLSGEEYQARPSFAGYNPGEIIYFKVLATNSLGEKSTFRANYLLPEIVNTTALTPISEVQGTGNSSPLLNQEVTIAGRVTANFDNSFYLQTGGGLRSGINVYGTLFTGKVGDSLVVRGTPYEYNGLTEISSPSYSYNFKNNLPMEPVVISASQVNEDYEGMLVQINNVMFANAGSVIQEKNASYTATDNTGSVVIYINTSSRLINKSFPTKASNLVGVVSEYNGTYQILARDISDLNITTKTEDLKQPEAMLSVYPNPTISTIYISGLSNIVSIEIYSANGELLYKKANRDNEINVSAFSPGIYFMKAETSKSNFAYTKFIKH
ncbi:MAG TPA: endonuclease [Draconibacterium sp.]|nr:endonuclease [Draconibacterium sp.]